MYYAIIKDEAARQRTINYLKTVDFGKAVYIDDHKKIRTRAQNNLWHKWLRIIGNHLGYNEKDMKHLIKLHSLGTVKFDNKKTGKVVERVKDSSELSKEEFAQLMTDTEIIAMGENISLPSPEDLRDRV